MRSEGMNETLRLFCKQNRDEAEIVGEFGFLRGDFLKAKQKGRLVPVIQRPIHHPEYQGR